MKLLLCVFYCLCMCTANAQDSLTTDHDSSYYKSYEGLLMGRFYFSQKYTNFEIGREKDVPRFRYYPNTTLNMGVGATYKSFTLNLAYGFGFLNKDDVEKIKTKYLDLQSHLYGRAWVIDLYGQFYKGYYLTPKGYGSTDVNKFYVRPDLWVALPGVSVAKLFNSKKFSYRAAFIQNEWQKKSAGSLYFSGEVFYGAVKGDSAFIPTMLSHLYKQNEVDKLHFIELGPGIGYVYTLVMAKRFFITGSLSLNANLAVSKEYFNNTNNVRFSVSPNYSYRFCFGYNSDTWSANASLVNNNVTIKGAIAKQPYGIATGNARLTVAKRFAPGPKLKKRLQPLDNLFNK